jgi:cytochrome c oxidase subunit 2
MSSSPRSRTSQTAVFALAVGAAIVGLSLILVGLGVNVLEAGQIFVGGLFPPVAVTTEGAQIRDLYTIVFLIAVAIFIVVEGLIIWTVIRYRRKPGDDTLPPQTHGNNIAEFVWTIVPTILVIFMFVISWQTLNQVDKSSGSAQTKIRAVAGQFQWTFDYLAPDGTTILYTEFIPLASQGGGMNVPAGRTVQLSLVSNDVIHAFYVPQFLFKRDVVPGRTNQFDFTVNESDVGQTFRGQCAELCGSGHSIMLFEVKALSAADFDAWLVVKSQPPSAPPAPSGGPGPSGQPAPSSGAADETLTLVAQGVKFDQTSLTASADTPFNIDFKNQDPGTPHNVAIHKGSPTGQEVFKGEIFPGVAEKVYVVPALQAGPYAFVCTVHPNMTGTLTVQ